VLGRLRRLGRRRADSPVVLYVDGPGSELATKARVFGERNDTLIVGDSHTLLCGAHHAYPGCDIDARVGRMSTEALELIEAHLADRHRVIVFEIATNDIMWPQGYAANLERLRQIAPGRQLVLVNTWREDHPNTHVHVNRALAEFHAAHPGETVLVDWAAYVDGHRLRSLGRRRDYVHFTRGAYRRRGELVRDAIAVARARAGLAPRDEGSGPVLAGGPDAGAVQDQASTRP
jgi:hypothetical protein